MDPSQPIKTCVGRVELASLARHRGERLQITNKFEDACYVILGYCRTLWASIIWVIPVSCVPILYLMHVYMAEIVYSQTVTVQKRPIVSKQRAFPEIGNSKRIAMRKACKLPQVIEKEMNHKITHTMISKY